MFKNTEIKVQKNISFTTMIFVILLILLLVYILIKCIRQDEKNISSIVSKKNNTYAQTRGRSRTPRKQKILPPVPLFDDKPREKPQFIKESKIETKCKEVVERLFNKKFEKIRPEFLRNKVTNRHLEIDIYNDELKLGFEVQGQQHYKYSPYFHTKGEHEFREQQYRDEIKRLLCKQHNIMLVEVPYFIKEHELESFIRTSVGDFGFIV